MTTEFGPRDLLIILQILSSAVGGIVVPYLDNVLGLRTREYLTYVLAAFESTGILFKLRLTFGLFIFPALASLFNLFAVWHALLLLPPMMRYIRGVETEDKFSGSMATVEIRFYLYFGPTVALYIVRFLWSIRGIIAAVSISLTGTLILCPNSLRSQVTAMVFKIAVTLIRLYSRYDINIRGLIIRACDALVAPFDRWEIEIVKWRRERRYRPLTSYQYRKLETYRHIRLLRLKRRSIFSEPSCELIQVPLDKAPAFEAISHTWGDKDPSIPIVVDGHQILVTAAVEELLFYRRSFFCSSLFWIDAICINQSDVNEKSEQLPLMTDIYRRAFRVLVWLGASESFQDTRIVRKMIRVLTWPLIFLSTSSMLAGLFDNDEQAFIAVGRLFSHPWFERIWVVQEVAVGKAVHVMYHGICVDWNTLASAAKNLGSDTDLKCRLLYHLSPKTTSTSASDAKLGRSSTINTMEQLHWPNLEFITKIREVIRLGCPCSLAHALGMTIPYKSKDPRDKIFAVLGIANDGSKLPFKPNYIDSIEDVFLKTTAFILSSEDWFIILTVTGRGYESYTYKKRSKLLDKLPSWVPDFSSDTIAGTRPFSEESIRLRDIAGKVTTTSDPRVIQLQVVEFDVIQHLGPKLKVRSSSLPYRPNSSVPIDTFIEQGTQFMANMGAEERDWYLSARRLARETSVRFLKSQEAADQGFWELCMSHGEHMDRWGPPPTVCTPLSSSFRKYFEFFFLTNPKESLSDGEPMLGSILGKKVTANEALLMQMYLFRRFSVAAGGKAFCLTASGSMALVPPLAREGDMLVHIRGGYVPIVLRRKSPGERRAELVGTCKVHYVEDVYSGSGWEDWLLE